MSKNTKIFWCLDFSIIIKTVHLTHRILILEEAAGLMGDYGDEINPVLRELIGKELMVYVVHKYKKVDNTQSLIFC